MNLTTNACAVEYLEIEIERLSYREQETTEVFKKTNFSLLLPKLMFVYHKNVPITYYKYIIHLEYICSQV